MQIHPPSLVIGFAVGVLLAVIAILAVPYALQLTALGPWSERPITIAGWLIAVICFSWLGNYKTAIVGLLLIAITVRLAYLSLTDA